MAIVVTMGVLLSACGGGGEDEEPEATSVPAVAQPTVEASADESTPGVTVPANTDMSSPDAIATPDGSESTPGVPPTTDVASPVATSDDAGSATPAIDTPAEDPEQDVATASTPAADTMIDGNAASTGDGTTGAVTPSLEATADIALATPSDRSAMATPASEASPQASPVSGTPPASSETPVVTDCDVQDVPAFEGDVTTYVLSVDLNFRSGPGSDCDLIGEGPLGEFAGVEIIGGPVIREGEESPEWVQVQVGEQTGWLALEFLDPAE